MEENPLENPPGGFFVLVLVCLFVLLITFLLDPFPQPVQNLAPQTGSVRG